MRLLSLSLLSLFLAPHVRAQAQPGDVFVKVLPSVNALCVHRPDGTQVACSQGTANDWWIGGALTPDLGWVTLSLTGNGYELLRFDHTGALTWQKLLPQIWTHEEIAATHDGRLVVADVAGRAIRSYDFFGNHLADWDLGASFTPHRICVGPDDDLWVFDYSSNQARHYDAAGNQVGGFSISFSPWDVELLADGTFWMTQLGSTTMRRLDTAGNQLQTLDFVHGSWPVGVAEDLDGTLWITAWNTIEVDHIDTNGNLLGSFLATGAPFFIQVVKPGGAIGTSYCGPANANSTGQPGTIAAFGRPFAHLNEVTLVAEQLPAHQLGMFLASLTPGFVTPPGSQGNLCLGGSIGRYVADAASTGASGRLELAIDTDAIPTSPAHQVMPGETWNFQLWHRDQNPHPTSNFTDGVSISFQ